MLSEGDQTTPIILTFNLFHDRVQVAQDYGYLPRLPDLVTLLHQPLAAILQT
jgi:hypothetical protein